MKYNLIKLIIGVLIIVCASCTSQEVSYDNSANQEILSESDMAELSVMQTQIDSINQIRFANNDVNTTRGRWKDFWNKFWPAACGDAAGALLGVFYGGGVGAGVGAAVASLAVFAGIATFQFGQNIHGTPNMAPPGINSPEIALNSSILPDISSETAWEDSIGFVHNTIITNVLPELAEEDLSIDGIMFKSSQFASIYYDLPFEDVYQMVYANKSLYCNIIVNELYYESDDENSPTLLDKWKMIYPDKADELTILGSYFEGLSNIPVDENDGSYMNEILGKIENSGLSKNVKQSLRNGIIVGNASYQLWNVESEE